MDAIDLRSDTVTLPTEQMRRAMASAKVGDDVYGEDETVNHLQELAADRMGKEAGLFIPSGTMGNLIAVLSHCGRGEEVIMGSKAHTFLFEAGGISALGGVHPHIIPNQEDGTLVLNDIKNAIRGDDVHFPISRLIILENTQNRCGGVPITANYTSEVAKIAHNNGMQLHLDGARIFNASVALDNSVKALAKSVDSITFCLSKGLCAPVGSVLCGSREFIYSARKIRKQLGGGMRQAGIIAAAGIVALETMIDRLVEDHDRAKKLAVELSRINALRIDKGSPHTNMLFLSLDQRLGRKARDVATKMKQQGILIGVVGEYQFRLVLHYWINDFGVERTVEVFKKVLSL